MSDASANTRDQQESLEHFEKTGVYLIRDSENPGLTNPRLIPHFSLAGRASEGNFSAITLPNGDIHEFPTSEAPWDMIGCTWPRAEGAHTTTFTGVMANRGVVPYKKQVFGNLTAVAGDDNRFGNSGQARSMIAPGSRSTVIGNDADYMRSIGRDPEVFEAARADVWKPDGKSFLQSTLTDLAKRKEEAGARVAASRPRWSNAGTSRTPTTPATSTTFGTPPTPSTASVSQDPLYTSRIGNMTLSMTGVTSSGGGLNRLGGVELPNLTGTMHREENKVYTDQPGIESFFEGTGVTVRPWNHESNPRRT